LLDPEIDMWEAATPVVRDYVNSAIGVKAQAEKLKSAAVKALEVAPKLPDYVDAIGKAVHRINEAGADKPAPAKDGASVRLAVWALGLVALSLAAIIAFG